MPLTKGFHGPGLQRWAHLPVEECTKSRGCGGSCHPETGLQGQKLFVLVDRVLAAIKREGRHHDCLEFVEQISGFPARGRLTVRSEKPVGSSEALSAYGVPIGLPRSAANCRIYRALVSLIERRSASCPLQASEMVLREGVLSGSKPRAAANSGLAPTVRWRAIGRIFQFLQEQCADHRLEQLGETPVGDRIFVNDIYITDWAREEETFWTDLEKEERLVLLRRYAVADAIDNDERKRAFSYTDVQDLFEEKTGDGPSDQYAYDLMEGAADGEEGIHYGEFSVGTSSSKIQLRVNVSEVSDAILNWVREETRFDPSSIGVTADVTSYASGVPPQPEGAADD